MLYYNEHVITTVTVTPSLTSTPDSNLICSINLSCCSLRRLLRLISLIFGPFPDLISPMSFLFRWCFFSFFVQFMWQTELLLSTFKLHLKSRQFPLLSFLEFVIVHICWVLIYEVKTSVLYSRRHKAPSLFLTIEPVSKYTTKDWPHDCHSKVKSELSSCIRLHAE